MSCHRLTLRSKVWSWLSWKCGLKWTSAGPSTMKLWFTCEDSRGSQSRCARLVMSPELSSLLKTCPTWAAIIACVYVGGVGVVVSVKPKLICCNLGIGVAITNAVFTISFPASYYKVDSVYFLLYSVHVYHFLRSCQVYVDSCTWHFAHFMCIYWGMCCVWVELFGSTSQTVMLGKGTYSTSAQESHKAVFMIWQRHEVQ